MTGADYAAHIILTVFLIFGIYQFYFWCQRNALRPSLQFGTALDDRIPFRPGWVWVYSGLYYPMIVYGNFAVESPRHFVRAVLSFIVLLFIQMAFFVIVPVTTPESWRHYDPRGGISERFLAWVHSYDASSNCFPSMHTSVAVLTAYHLQPQIGAWAWVFPALISVSCLFTKQHYIVDVPAGAALGWLAYRLYGLFA